MIELFESGVIHGPKRDYPIERNLVELFEAQTERSPDTTAIVSSDGNATYAQLANRSNQIAAWLQHRNIAPEQPIGVLQHRSIDMVATLLGILKAGGAYVPFDSDDPPERNQRILQVAGCHMVLGHRTVMAALEAIADSDAPNGAVEFVDVEHIAETKPTASPTPSAPGGDRLAYLIFTSGSTGRPKGVEVEHRSLINLLCAARDMIGFTDADRMLAVSTIGFDISVAEIFLPLITGGSLLLRDRNLLMNPRQLASDVAAHGVTVVQTGPSVWRLLLSQVTNFPNLRVAITTAEAVSPSLANDLTQHAATVWNLYGPTEATVWATAHRVKRADAPPTNNAANANAVPIGHPIANMNAILVDENEEIVANGEVGELCVGGVGVARGYRNDANLTNEKFKTLGGGSERYYKTGDLAMWKPDYGLHYLGRNDEELKIRGVRIDPTEVESAICEHADVMEAAVTWFPVSDETKGLVAAYVTAASQTVTPEDLHRWLESRLPPPMIPSRFHVLDAIPRSPSGKVDRNYIRSLTNASGADDQSDPDAPSVRVAERAHASEPTIQLTDTERRLGAIWRRLLKLKHVAPDDHFFSVGGDSLVAVRMLLDAEAEFKIQLPVRIVFEAPTLSQLAARIEREIAQPEDHSNSHYIFPLTDTSSERPLFFHTVDLKLAAKGNWTARCPLYGISHWAQGDGFAEARTLTELARTHVAQIRQLQPKGPYRIAGYSFGGLVALETAQQLRAQGQTVEILFLLDPMQPRFVDGRGSPTEEYEAMSERTIRHIRGVARKPTGIFSYIWTRLANRLRRNPIKPWILYHLMHLHGRKPNPISTMLLPKNRWPAYWYAAKRLARNYVAKNYAGPVVAIFCARDNRYDVWRGIIGDDAEFHIVGGAHVGMFADSVMRKWMPILEMAIDEANKE